MLILLSEDFESLPIPPNNINFTSLYVFGIAKPDMHGVGHDLALTTLLYSVVYTPLHVYSPLSQRRIITGQRCVTGGRHLLVKGRIGKSL
jgi:hypothetical protein